LKDFEGLLLQANKGT